MRRYGTWGLSAVLCTTLAVGIWLTGNTTRADAQWAKLLPGSYRVLAADSDGKTATLVSVWDPYTHAAQAEQASGHVVNFQPRAFTVDTQSLFQNGRPGNATWEQRALNLDGERLTLDLLRVGGGYQVISESPNVQLALSPDRTAVAIIDSRKSGLWLYEVRSGSIRRLTAPAQGSAGSLLDGAPFWSADGNTLFFSSSRTTPRRPDVWRVSAAGGAEQLVVDARRYGPLYIRGIAASGHLVLQGNEDIFLVAPSGDSVVTLVPRAILLSVSPDGRWATYRSVSQTREAGALKLVDLGNGTSQEVAAPAGYKPEGQAPVWSPSGRRMAGLFINPRDPEDRLLAVIDISGAVPQLLTYRSPLTGTAFDFNALPSWLGDSYLVVRTVRSHFGNQFASADPQSWLLHLGNVR